MDGWRISKRRYAQPPAAAFDGEGSRRRGGRWTPPGTRVAYASSSLALASLEYFVNLDPEDAPFDLVSIRVSIPDRVRCERVDVANLTQSWRGTISARTLGSRGKMAGISLVSLPAGALGGGAGRVQLADQPGARGFQGTAVLRSGPVQLRSADVEVTSTELRE
jgi:RES domain-containing protein